MSVETRPADIAIKLLLIKEDFFKKPLRELWLIFKIILYFNINVKKINVLNIS